jgi:tripartite ATP-independent transporter DctM subunit
METFLIIALLMALLFMGVPIAFALGIAGAVGIYSVIGFTGMMTQLSGTAYRSVAHSTLAAIPLFILMAEFMNSGGIARDVFDAARKIVGRLPGGLSIATVCASAGFGAVSGSSTAAAGTLASISLPEFKRLGYSLPAATGVVAVAGTLAVMIPPSIAFIIYGVMTETSIGKLLIAGIVPGLLTTLAYVIAILIWAKTKPETLPRGDRWPLREKVRALRGVSGFAVIVFVVFVSLYGGIATATEVAAIGASSTLVYLLATRRFSRAGFANALARTMRISAMMLFIVVGAMIFGYYLTISRAPQDLIAWIAESGLSPLEILALILLIYIVLGCMMDQIAILLITLPMTFPLVTSLGYDPIWFGVVVVKLVEIGLVTPPLGMNVFVVSATTGVPVGAVFRGTAYLLVFEAITLALLLAFPVFSLWLPSMM